MKYSIYLWNWIDGSNYPLTKETRTPFQFLLVLVLLINWGMEIINYHYRKVHRWLAKTYGKATRCEHCNNSNLKPNMYHWALKKGCSYDFNRNNFIQLCNSCHHKYDTTEIFRKNCSDRMKIMYYNSNFCQLGNKREKSPVAKRVFSIDKKGNVEHFKSITSVFDKYPNYWRGNIQACLAKQRKTAHKKIWQYFSTK